ncbi:hypothetical protein [Promicromonospora sp. NPDC059942]|uniref:hypothetical protein n=1 Tax=Promicromonospora sp. NPDC059942 TaxID=3347009 RepID=UPI0036472F5E
MLHLEARRRGGDSLNPEESARLKRWLDEVHLPSAVVHYDPETVDGYVSSGLEGLHQQNS